MRKFKGHAHFRSKIAYLSSSGPLLYLRAAIRLLSIRVHFAGLKFAITSAKIIHFLLFNHAPTAYAVGFPVVCVIRASSLRVISSL